VQVFVSGCYDLLHGGHVQFFEEVLFKCIRHHKCGSTKYQPSPPIPQAKAVGDHLTVCFAGDARCGEAYPQVDWGYQSYNDTACKLVAVLTPIGFYHTCTA
jgi:hypothetical protein